MSSGLRHRFAPLALSLLGACLVAGCGRAPSEPAAVAAQPADETELEPILEPEFAVDAAPPDLAVAVPAADTRAPAATPARAARRRSTKPEPTVETAESHVPLESLLRAPTAPLPKPSPVDLSAKDEPAESAEVPPPFGSLERWKDRVHVERRTDPIGRSGAKQGTYTETDASLRVPVDDSVSLEGGVRVDSRDEPGTAKPEHQSIPRVGVEVRF